MESNNISTLNDSTLFRGLSSDEINDITDYCSAGTVKLSKNEILCLKYLSDLYIVISGRLTVIL